MRRIFFTVCLLLAVSACSTTPKEVVELSYKVGEDMQAVGSAYRALVKTHFDSLRQQRIDYLENQWKPAFIANWLKNGRLVDMAQGTVRWDFNNETFAAPTPGKEKQQLLASVMEWSSGAIEQIEQKKKALLDPLNEDESKLLADIDTAFQRIGRANNAITAHLNSLRKVEEVQDEYLAELGVKDFREKLMQQIQNLSEKAAAGLAEVKKADGLVSKQMDR